MYQTHININKPLYFSLNLWSRYFLLIFDQTCGLWPQVWYKQWCMPKVVGCRTVPQGGLLGNSHNALGRCVKAS